MPGAASRSLRVEVAPGVSRSVVDGVVHEFPSVEALDAFLKKNGLGSAFGARIAVPPRGDDRGPME